MLLAPGHPTYKVLAQPTFEYATCAWSPHIRGTRPTNAQECCAWSPHIRGTRPTNAQECCAWSPHIRGTRPTNAQECYLRLVTPHTRYSSNQHFSVSALVLCLLYPNVEFALWPSLHRFVYHYCHQHSFYVCSIPMWNSLTQEAVTAPTAETFQKGTFKVIKSL